MKTMDVAVDDHLIQISYRLFSAREIVTYDRKTVSEKRTIRWTTNHAVVVEEDGDDVTYEVVVSGFSGYTVRRNGSIVAEHKRMSLLYLEALGFLVICALLLRLLLYLCGLLVSEPFGAIRRMVEYWDELVVFLGAFPVAWWRSRHLRHPANSRHTSEEP